MQGAGGRQRCAGGATGREIPLPNTRRAVVLVAGIAGRGKKQRPGIGDRVDRLGDDHVLEGRLVEVRDVVDDDGAAGRLQGEDVVGEAGIAVEGGGKEHLSAGQQVLNDFHHCRSLITGAGLAAKGACAGIQFARGFRHRQGVGAIGQDPDLQPRAVDAESGARTGGEVCGIAAGQGWAEIGLRLDGRFDKADPGMAGKGCQMGGGESGAQTAEAWHGGDNFAAGFEHEALQVGRDAAADVKEQAAVCFRAHGWLEFGQGGKIGGAGLAFEQVDQLRIEAAFGGRAPCLLGQQNGDLALCLVVESLRLHAWQGSGQEGDKPEAAIQAAGDERHQFHGGTVGARLGAGWFKVGLPFAKSCPS